MRWRKITLDASKGKPLIIDSIDEPSVYVIDITYIVSWIIERQERIKRAKKYFYMALLCLIALTIVIACAACIYYKMPERGIPL